MNLGNVQQSAVVPAQGYMSMPYRTGYESVIASRVGDLYAISAPKAGKVTEVNDNFIKVKFDDGTEKGWELGVRHGVAEGKTIPHEIITDLVKGHKFEEGHVLAWNTGFFERDDFSPANVTMMTGALARTVLLENNDTLEDGSRVGPGIREKLASPSSKQKGILVNFDQDINNLVKVGDEVEYDSILCQITEQAASDLAGTDAGLAGLSKLSGNNPKAKYAGKISKIEFFYNGDMAEMSPTLKKLVKGDNNRRKNIRENTGARMSDTGEIKRATFVAGEKVILGTVAVVIYIDSLLEHGIGDKAVVCNQLKSVHGATLEGVNKTADGKDIDIFFGYRSVNDRIVNSPLKQGSVNSVMIKASEMFAHIAETGKKP